MNTPKIVFKSDIPEDALNALAAVFIEQIEKPQVHRRISLW